MWIRIARAMPFALLGSALACEPAADRPGAGTVRLVTAFTDAAVEARVPLAAPPARTEWRFDGSTLAMPAWQASAQAGMPAIVDGRLAGRSRGVSPIVAFPRPAAAASPDQIHSVEIRMRASAGANLSLYFLSGEKLDLAAVEVMGMRTPVIATVPLLPGEEMQSYVLAPPISIQGSALQFLALRPTDVAGADFAIESVRILFRNEYLASLATGVSWQGLRDVYRETLVARSPERLRFAIDLPPEPWLDLAVGTTEKHPVAFAIAIREAGKEPAIARRHVVTTPYRWEPLAVDLRGFAGRSIELTLELAADSPGRVGLWGSPVVRSNRAIAAAGRTETPPRGVILIQADTLRRDHLDVYGHDRATAPFLARWAEGGVRFAHAISQAPWTKVSTPSILTSLYPSTHGVKLMSDRLPANATTVAERFREAGYATLSLLSVPFTGQMTNLHQGFEEVHESTSHSARGTPLSAKTAREYVDRLSDWIDRRDGAPWFAFLHVFDPHSPYEPYSPYDELWVTPEQRTEHVRQRDLIAPTIADSFMKARKLPSRDETAAAGFDPAAYIAVETSWYDASIRAMDVELERLVEHLRGAGREGETLIVLLSDHGTEFYEHGTMFHGHSLYGELTDVPILASWPGRIAAGRTIDPVVQTIDVVPTLLELAGLPPVPEAQGQSLVPFLRPDAAPAADGSWPGWRSRPAVSERSPNTPDARPPRHHVSDALTGDRFKLVQNRTEGFPPFELYDWRADPLNQRDLAGENPEVVQRMAAELDAWRRRAEAQKLPADAAVAGAMSAEELQQLRSLGYIR